MNRSFFITFLLDVKVFDLVFFLVGSYNIQELSEAMLFQVFLSQVFQVSFWEWNVSLYVDFSLVVWNLDVLTKFAQLAINFDSLS